MKNGESIRNTADILNISKSTVHHIWTKYVSTKHVKDGQRSGRPKKVQIRDEWEVIREVNKNPLQSVPKLLSSFNLTRNPANQVKESTIRNILKKNNLISKRLATKWKISPKNVKERLIWAKEMIK